MNIKNIKWANIEHTVIVIDKLTSMMYPVMGREKPMIDKWLETNQIQDFTDNEKNAILDERKKSEALAYLNSTQAYSRVFEDDPDAIIPLDVKAKRDKARRDLR